MDDAGGGGGGNSSRYNYQIATETHWWMMPGGGSREGGGGGDSSRSNYQIAMETHWWMMPGGDTGTCLLLGDLDVRGRNISGQVIPWNRETFLCLFTVHGQGFPIKYKNGQYYFLIIWISSELDKRKGKWPISFLIIRISSE